MLNILTQKFSEIINKISNKGRITEKNIKETLRDVRTSLLEADVALPIVKNFINDVKLNAIGKNFNKSLTPGQEFIKIIKKELIQKLGENNDLINLSVKPPAVFLIIGLQGMGKTTSLVKLGKKIKEKTKKKILTVSTDTYRPAAIKQLEILSLQAKIDFVSLNNNLNPINIAKHALKYAKRKLYDLLLIDTAGRLHIDSQMMAEIQKIHQLVNPIETLLVVDAMMGQDIINVSNVFNKILPITGFILTKMDSDARGGIILSVKGLTNKPIKFISNGEKLDDIELFNSERIANRILGMGDVLSLIEDIENKIKLKPRAQPKKKYDLNDFSAQIDQILKIGGLTSLIKKLPQNNDFNNNLLLNTNNDILIKYKTIISSMTLKERVTPGIIKGSRKRRIALGSGVNIQNVNQLLKQFHNIKTIMNKIKKTGISKAIQNIKNIIPKSFL